MDKHAATAADSSYLTHQKVYPRDIQGRFARYRTLAVWTLLGLFYLLPWLNLHDRQAVLFDLRARKFYLFDLVMWPQDFIFLTWLLVIAALSLFFFTALAGRLWCGYACPQTVWTETFLWMERFAEGDRGARMKLDAAPWSFMKLRRKALKQLLWVSFALWTGLTFVGFFTPIRPLLSAATGGTLSGWETFWLLFYGFATYGNAGLLREQVCKYMCPYARFQSAMFDQDTLVITYDPKRGEPRGARRRSDAAVRGDCIDCTWCVQVCPTGIDIRNGLQYDCIGCAACIDACDQIMDHVGSPRGLIRYTTQHALEQQPTRVLRPRTLIYAAILGALVVGFAVALALRKPVGLDVIRDRRSLYRLLDDGRVENVYTLKILNKSEQPHSYVVRIADAPDLSIDPPATEYRAEPGEVRSVIVRVRRAAFVENAVQSFTFTVRATDDVRLNARHTTRFLEPRE